MLEDLCTSHHSTSPRPWRRGQQARREQRMPPRPINHRHCPLVRSSYVVIKMRSLKYNGRELRRPPRPIGHRHRPLVRSSYIVMKMRSLKYDVRELRMPPCPISHRLQGIFLECILVRVQYRPHPVADAEINFSRGFTKKFYC